MEFLPVRAWVMSVVGTLARGEKPPSSIPDASLLEPYDMLNTGVSGRTLGGRGAFT